MEAAFTALNASLPAFLLIIVGAFADRLFPKLDLETLTRLSIYFTIPALIFDATAKTELTFSAASLLMLGYLLYLVVLGAVAWLSAAGLSPLQKRGLLVTSLFGNTGNMGLPITLFAYGAAGLERAVVIFIVSLVAMFAIGPAVLAGGTGGMVKRIWETLRLPPLWGALAGLALNLADLSLPVGLGRGVTLLGQAAIPVMLFSLGLQMRRTWVWGIGVTALRATGVRMLIGPLLAYGLGWLIGLRGLDLSVLTLSAAMPAAVTMFVVAVEVRGDAEGVGRTVIATTLVSILVITAVIYFLPA